VILNSIIFQLLVKNLIKKN